MLEDELHFLTSCKKHTNEREELYRIFKSKCLNFENQTNEEKMIYMMSNEDKECVLKLSMYIYNCMKKEGHIC